ncbi:MAG TPA: helix-turn-helix transcriptional regulator [Hyphomicrobium sp.]|nr:helix-turn-helix transcriptional regulator [Hyphomicrobium sp.]
MNKLKDLRTKFGFTQKRVAEHLETTQQTIQRWESGHTEIPAGQLKDLSILFGCSVDELLGMDTKTKRREEGFARARHETPWGTLRVRFAFGEREYPIDDHERDNLLEEFHSAIDLKRPNGWVEFTALDNRLVFLNPAFVQDVEVVTDDHEAMPFFASPEAYQALSKYGPLTDAGPLLQEECTNLLMHLGVGNGRGEPDLDQAREKLNSLEVVRGDGKSFTSYLTDDVATSIFILEDQREIEPNTFLTVFADYGLYRSINLSNAALIEVPVEAYLTHTAKDTDEG